MMILQCVMIFCCLWGVGGFHVIPQLFRLGFNVINSWWTHTISCCLLSPLSNRRQMSTFCLSVSTTCFLFSTTLGMMKASGDKQCTESLSKHSAVGCGWREVVRSGGKGKKYASRGNFNQFYEYTYWFFIDFKARGKMRWILEAAGYSNAG